MTILFQHLAQWDALFSNAYEHLRWSPLTVLFVLASAWWVKAPLFVVVGALSDLRARRAFPLAAGTAMLGVAAAGIVSTVLKQTLDRTRPPDAGIGVDALVATPLDPSFPSGHTLTAFAAATVVSCFHPRLRLPLFALAALVGASRLYLGVHFTLDVLAGAALGIGIGLLTVRLVRLLVTRTTAAAAPPDLVPVPVPVRSRAPRD